MVSKCFKKIEESLRRLLNKELDCELPFPKIGKLQIRNKIVNMIFYRDYLKNLTRKENNAYEFENRVS